MENATKAIMISVVALACPFFVPFFSAILDESQQNEEDGEEESAGG